MTCKLRSKTGEKSQMKNEGVGGEEYSDRKYHVQRLMPEGI